MTFKFNNATQALTAAFSDASAMTTSIWMRGRPTNLANGVTPLKMYRELQMGASGNFNLGGQASGDSGFQPANAAWTYLALQKTGGDWRVLAFEDISAETLHTIYAQAYLGGSTVVGSLLGDAAGNYAQGPTACEFCYWRVWNSFLTSAQLNAEKNSTTPVITSGLVLDCTLATDLTAATGSAPTITAGSGETYTANVPSSVAAPVVNLQRGIITPVGAVGAILRSASY